MPELDTFALRQGELADRLRIFEVDHPASQAMKRERLLAINDSVPANLVLVPVDFESDRLDERLMEAGFDRGAPAFFSWLGTTYYLTKEAIRDTLERVSAVTASGSRIVLDYKYPRRLIPEQSLLFADKVDQFVARRGEPMRSTFAPEELTAELARAGSRNSTTSRPTNRHNAICRDAATCRRRPPTSPSPCSAASSAPRHGSRLPQGSAGLRPHSAPRPVARRRARGRAVRGQLRRGR